MKESIESSKVDIPLSGQIASAVVAAVLSRPTPPPTTEGAIVELYQAHAIQEARTDYQEDLLSVTQG